MSYSSSSSSRSSSRNEKETKPFDLQNATHPACRQKQVVGATTTYMHNSFVRKANKTQVFLVLPSEKEKKVKCQTDV